MVAKRGQLLADLNREIRFWWNQGFNTFEIAKKTKMSEAKIYNTMALWRARGNGKQSKR